MYSTSVYSTTVYSTTVRSTSVYSTTWAESRPGSIGGGSQHHSRRRMVMSDDDGRFSAEELDRLLGAARGATDTGATDDRPGADAPLAALRSLASHHRVIASAVTVVIVVAAAGGAAALVSRPPPPAATIEATVTLEDLQTVAGSSARLGDLLRTSLVVTTSDDTDRIQPVALVGEGLDQPTVTTDGPRLDTTNRLSCHAISNLTRLDQLALRLTSTDPWGRPITEDIPLTGVGVPEVYDRITRFCQQQLGQTVFP